MNVQAQFQTESRIAQFSLLCSNLVYTIPSSAFCALALTFVPSEAQLALSVRLTWLLLVCILLSARAIVLYRWLQEPTTANNLQKRLNLATLLTTATGCCFGAIGFLTVSPEFPLITLTVVMILTGMVAGATASISHILPMYILYLFPVMVPIALRMLSFGEPHYVWVGGLIALYFVANLGFSSSIRASILRSIELRFENMELLDDLKQEHERAEIALAREEKANLAKSHFLAAASHDLRQPLHSLRLFTATLELQTRNTEHKTLVNQIDLSVKSLEELFNALLDISKLDAGTVSVDNKHVNLDNLLTKIEGEFKPLAEEKQLKFTAQRTGQVVHTDIPLLETLLRNLASNAIRYTQSGSVSITTETINNRVVISVTDTGVGIAETDKKKIFDEFVQLGNAERDRNQGIGLGLSIVRRLADLLDIQVRVESRVGHGTTFYVGVPEGDRSQCQGITTRLLPTDYSKSLFVLVVDDEEDACLAMEGLLETWGYVVMCAISGDAAIQQLMEIGEAPDIVISDYRLRDGETGGDVVKRLRIHLGYELPAIIVTGDIAAERLVDIKTLGLPTLHKPCEPQALRQLITRETRIIEHAACGVG